jgi:hypothetical protein
MQIFFNTLHPLRIKENRTTGQKEPFHAANIDKELERAESMLRQLSASMGQIRRDLQVERSAFIPENTDAIPELASYRINEMKEAGNSVVTGPSHSFSSFQEASSNLGALKSSLLPSSELDNTRMVLNGLSSSLAIGMLGEKDSELPSRFWIPTRRVGYTLISREIQAATLLSPL